VNVRPVLWLDNHLSPAFARRLSGAFEVDAKAIRDLGLGAASDQAIFDAARAQASAIITKDRDFAELAKRRGPPPTIVLLGIGNTSTSNLIAVIEPRMRVVLAMIAAGEAMIEIGPA
jgi:predicted nuclease of predicted toxin-antitoxin system